MFGLEDYGLVRGESDKIQASDQFVRRPDVNDEGISNHPLWTESFPAAIKDKIIEVLKKSRRLIGFLDFVKISS